jgi:hypothetical protein
MGTGNGLSRVLAFVDHRDEAAVLSLPADHQCRPKMDQASHRDGDTPAIRVPASGLSEHCRDGWIGAFKNLVKHSKSSYRQECRVVLQKAFEQRGLTVAASLAFIKRAMKLVTDRFRQIADHCTAAGLQESFNGHARQKFQAIQAPMFVRRDRNFDGVVDVGRLRIATQISGNVGNNAVDLRGSSLIECRESKSGLLPPSDLINLMWREPSLDFEIVSVRHELHDLVSGAKNSPYGMNHELMNNPRGRCTNFDPV